MQILQGRFTGTLAPATQRNGEMENLESELWSRGLGVGDPGARLASGLHVIGTGVGFSYGLSMVSPSQSATLDLKSKE